MIDLDIIQPCYNPSPHWEKSVYTHFTEIEKLLPNVTIALTIINDGSKLNLNNEAIEYLQKNIKNFQYISYPQNRGKGFALREGVKLCKGQLQIYTDIDFPYELINIYEMYNQLINNIDIVVGVREKNYYSSISKQRMIASKIGKMLNKFFLEIPFSDTQSGLKGFNQTGRTIFLETKTDRYLFDTEFIVKASRNKEIKMVSIPINLRKDVVLSKMNLNIFLEEFLNFIRICYLSFRKK